MYVCVYVCMLEIHNSSGSADCGADRWMHVCMYVFMIAAEALTVEQTGACMYVCMYVCVYDCRGSTDCGSRLVRVCM